MTTRSIPAPAEGLYFFGPRPVSIEVREVPAAVSDAELTAFVAAIAASPRGLHLNQGEGAGGSLYSRHWKELLGYARERGIAVPAPAAADTKWPHVSGGTTPARGRIVDGVETNENGQPLHPQTTAREAGV